MSACSLCDVLDIIQYRMMMVVTLTELFAVVYNLNVTSVERMMITLAKGRRTPVRNLLMRLWLDEQGDMVQNLGWLVAVSVGVVVVGAVIYTAVSSMGDRVKNKIDSIS